MRRPQHRKSETAAAARVMSEQRRAFLALEGKTFPRIGDRGRYIHNELNLGAKPERAEAAIVVLDVSVSGLTATVRFAARWARIRFCRKPFCVHRRGNGVDGSGWYLPCGTSPTSRRLTGEVLFTPGDPVLPWSLA